MHSSTSGRSTLRTNWLRRLAMLGASLVFICTLNVAGCPQPTYQQMFEGATLKDVMNITANADLTEDEKIEALAELGIEDEQVTFLLINAPMPVNATQSGADQ